MADDNAVIEHFVDHADEMAGTEVCGERKAEAKARLNTRGGVGVFGAAIVCIIVDFSIITSVLVVAWGLCR